MAQNSPLIPSVAGYSTPDGFRHAIVATSGGKLHEIFFNPQKGKGIARLACFDAINCLDGFFAADDGYQLEIIATADGNVHEIYFKPNDIHFSQPPLAHFNGITNIAGFFAKDDKMRIVIVATADGNVTEIFYNSTIGVHISQPPLAHFNNIVGVAGFYAEDDKMRIVIVATADGNVTEIFYNSTIGVHISQPPLAHFNNIVGVAGFYAEDDKMRIVIVATADGNVTEIFYNSTIGVHISQPPLAHFSGIVGIAAFYSSDDRNRHVIVATADGNVTEIFYNSTIGVHISQPPLAQFGHPAPTLEDISPDPSNVDATTIAGLAATSSSGRVIGLAGSPNAIYAVIEKSGVWKSKNGAPWVQLSASPSEAVLEGPQIAVEPGNDQHVVAVNIRGAWESTDEGITWKYIYDPKTNQCRSQQVLAVAFAPNGTLVLGTQCGIAHRAPNAATFSFFNTPDAIRAFAVSETKVWARTEKTLLVSSDNGQSWPQSSQVPDSVNFDFYTMFSLAAFDDFAFMAFSTTGVPQPCGTCGSDVKLLIFNATTSQWKEQNVTFAGCQVCDGTGLGGRKFVKSFIRRDTNQPMTVGQRLQLFYGAGQALYQANGLNPDGTVIGWSRPVTTFENGTPNPDVHVDIWDFNIDITAGGDTAWVACDGGVFMNKPIVPYQFPGGGWTIEVKGLHTHQLHTLTVLPTTPVGRSRLAYPTSDNNAWCRDSTPIVLPAPKWQAVEAGGDANFSVGDAGLPHFALLARHRAWATLKQFGGADKIGIVLANYKNNSPSAIGPDGPTTIQFIQGPKGFGSATLDAVMMVDLPLIDPNNVPFDSNSPLGQSSNGLPVLIRNKNFSANPDINTSRGAGWSIEIGTWPAGTQGFYVTGTPATPVYFAFGDNGSGLFLSKWNGNSWTTLGITGLLSSLAFGPAFINPFDQNVLYVITGKGIQLSTNGGASFSLDAALSALVKGAQGLLMNNLAHMAFNYDNPREIAAVTVSGGVFFNIGDGSWTDLTNVMLTPHSPLVAVGIDCESIYVATDGRSLVRINDYKNV